MNQIDEGLHPMALGQHVIADFYDASQLVECASVGEVLREAAEAAKAKVLNLNVHDFGARYGFTGVAVLAESHISIHTWPENGYAAIDIFMCGDAQPMRCVDVLRRYFNPGREDVRLIRRGLMAPAKASPAALPTVAV